MAGLIGVDNTWFKNNGQNLGNANDLKAGISVCYYGDAAASLNYPHGYCIVVTFYSTDYVKLQFAVNGDASSSHLSYRMKWENWSVWQQII